MRKLLLTQSIFAAVHAATVRWGAPECLGHPEFFSYAYCCNGYIFNLCSTGFGHGCCVAEDGLPPLQIEADATKSRKDEVYQGCEAPFWREFLSMLKLTSGNVVSSPMFARRVEDFFWHDSTGAGQPVYESGLAVRRIDAYDPENEECSLGGTLLVFVFFQHFPVDEFRLAAGSAQRRVLLGLDDLAERGVTDQDLFDLAGLSFTAMRYLVLNFDLESRFSGAAFVDDLVERTSDVADKIIVDLGMADGMDTLFYSSLGYTVLSVEGNPASVKKVRAALPKKEFPRTTVLHAAISENLSREKVPFYLNSVSGEFGSLDIDRANYMRESYWKRESTPVHTIGCDSLIGFYGKPYYLKIDIEGADMDCISQLTRNTAPLYISIELPPFEKCIARPSHGETRAFPCRQQYPNSTHNGTWLDAFDEAKDILYRLGELGYTRFKIVPQSLFNNKVKDNAGLLSSATGVGCSGPFGDHALDLVHGVNWRGSEVSVLHDLAMYGPAYVACVALPEWFDLHATLPEDQPWSSETETEINQFCGVDVCESPD